MGCVTNSLPIMAFDPLRHYYKKLGCNHSLIQETVLGEKYTAVILTDGRVGVCATLGNEVEKVLPGFVPDLKKVTHRIILNAYYNALLNYDHEFEVERDIFDEVDFKQYKQIVMVGWFRTLHKKFRDAKLEVAAFDQVQKDRYLSPIGDMPKIIAGADAIVVSSTTIFNMTLKEVNDMAPLYCDIFMLGPSTILHEDMFRYTRIKTLFGSIFKPHDKAVLNIIKSGCGTPEFSGHMKKVFLKRP